MNKAIVFTYDEFEELVYDVTYGIVGINWDMYDGWFWTEMFFEDEEWNEWLEEYGEETEAEINEFPDDEDLVYHMIGKKFNATVKTVIVDVKGGEVAVIFE